MQSKGREQHLWSSLLDICGFSGAVVSFSCWVTLAINRLRGFESSTIAFVTWNNSMA